MPRVLLRLLAFAAIMMLPLLLLPKTGTTIEKPMANEPVASSDMQEQRETSDGETPLPSENEIASDSTDPEQPTYPGVTTARILRGGNGKPGIRIHYPVTGNAAVDEDLKKWLTDRADSFEKESDAETGDGGERPDNYSQWELSVSFAISKPQPEIFSVIFNVYSYQGGVHGNLSIVCRNYNLSTGKRLDLSDLFRNPEKALVLMSAWSRKELSKNLGKDADDAMIHAGTEPDTANFGNLMLIPEGLNIEFSPYQVASWAEGQQQVVMPLSELAEAGPERNIWPNAPEPQR